MRLAAFAAILVLSAACSSGPPAAASSPTVGNAASPSPVASASPTPPAPTGTETLTCAAPPTPGHALALIEGAEPGELDVLDVSDSVRPSRLCALREAEGGRFVSATRIAFWAGRNLGFVDVVSGNVTFTAQLSDTPTQGAFSADGATFAYRVGSDTNGLTTHLVVRGADHVLISRPGIGGHGGPPYGPISQLAFSADGKYLLSVDSLIANFASGPPNFIVYRMDGSMAFQSAVAAFGVWAPSGAKLYFLAPTQSHGVIGSVHTWDASSGEATLTGDLATYVWPALSPTGSQIVFTSYDSNGLPHIWQVDLATKNASLVSSLVSSHPVFVGPHTIWSNEEKPCDCGPGGASMPDGLALSNDLMTGAEGGVQLDVSILSGPTNAVLDVWIPAA